MNNKPVLLASIILAISLIICSFVLKGSNLLQSFIPPQQGSTLSVPDSFKIDQKDVLLLYDASVYLGMEENTLKSAIIKNELPELPYMKIGDTYLFSKKLLNVWIQDNIKKKSQYKVTKAD
jgi:hypothetical protein